ncbi:MAG: hypothetical protein RR523_12620 [Cetobacterium sp.]|uniref:ABC-three component system protein n=1 Tax=Cetobacterium sp. TaxID=2071632 RepID=UPI002FCC338C
MFYHTFDATKSWYGYEYQGKLAIKKALEYISEEIDNRKLKKFEELEKFAEGLELEIEKNEDFAILKEGKYISIHQVKTGKIDNPATNNMYFNYLENNNDDKNKFKIYLHYTEGTYSYESSLESFQKEINKILEEVKIYLSDEKKRSEINLTKREKKKHSIEKALLNLNSEKDNLEENLLKIESALKQLSLEEINKEVFVFQKEKEVEIDSEIEKILKQILEQLDYKLAEIPELIKSKLLNMCYILDTHLEEIVTKKKNKPILFLKFIEILKKDNLKLPKNYEAFMKMEKIINVLEDTCKHKDFCDEKECENDCNVKETLKKLREIRGEKLLNFIKYIKFPYGINDIDHPSLDKLLQRLLRQEINFDENNFYINEQTECGTLDIRDSIHEKSYIREFQNNRNEYNELIMEKKYILTENFEIKDILNKGCIYSEYGYEIDSRDILEGKNIEITTYKKRMGEKC